MFGTKSGFLAAMAATLLLFSGCGADGKVDGDAARNWYNEMQGNGTVTHHTDPDGYGVDTGGPNWGDSTNNTERNTYGMRTDGTADTNGGTTLGQDMRNAWDNVTGNNGNTGNNR